MQRAHSAANPVTDTDPNHSLNQRNSLNTRRAQSPSGDEEHDTANARSSSRPQRQRALPLRLRDDPEVTHQSHRSQSSPAERQRVLNRCSMIRARSNSALRLAEQARSAIAHRRRRANSAFRDVERAADRDYRRNVRADTASSTQLDNAATEILWAKDFCDWDDDDYVRSYALS